MLKVLVPVLSLPGAALSTKTKMPCSMPGCRKDAASPRAKFCMTCFKTNASLANARRKAFRGRYSMSKKTKKKCSRPGCGKDAASPRAKFCMACFKTNASLASAQRKAFRGGGGGGVPGNRGNSKGAPGNRGNSGAQGAPGNRGNTTAGRKKKLAGKRSALRRSTKLLLVVKNPWLDLILAKKKDVGDPRCADEATRQDPPRLERSGWSHRWPMSHHPLLRRGQERAQEDLLEASRQ